MFFGMFGRSGRVDCSNMPPINREDAAVNMARVDATITDIVQAVATAKAQHEDVVRKNELLEALIYAAGGYIWLKGPDGKYKWCDHKFCEDFFGLSSPHCDVRGLTDVELLNMFRTRTGHRHSFGDLCLSTDAHCLEQGDQCRYIEVGYIGDSLFVLDVVKTPMYHDGVLRGVVGFGQDRSNECRCIQEQLGRWTKAGRIECLTPAPDSGEPSVGAWWVKPCSEHCTCDIAQFFCKDGE